MPPLNDRNVSECVYDSQPNEKSLMFCQIPKQQVLTTEFGEK